MLIDIDVSGIIIFCDITDNVSPQIYKEYVVPYFKKYSREFSKKGIISGVHAHASNLDGYKDVINEFDAGWIEAFTPPPYGDLALSDARKCWGAGCLHFYKFS